MHYSEQELKNKRIGKYARRTYRGKDRCDDCDGYGCVGCPCDKCKAGESASCDKCVNGFYDEKCRDCGGTGKKRIRD